MGPLQERRWIALAGRATFVTARGPGLELELRSGADAVSVRVADASGFQPASLLNRYVRIAGVGHAALSGGQRPILDRLFLASGADLKCVEAENETSDSALRLMDIAQIQAMSIPEAQRELPVRVRGVVTAANRSDHWLSLQDDTRGIFVDLHGISNSFPARAELWEVIGNTAKGNFAPVVVAKEIKRLGNGRMPEPARPSWNELASGSMDVQWVEFQGLVSGVHSNVLDLLLPEGPLQVLMENHFEPELQACAHAVVRVRGTLFAIWNADTREVQFGSLLMRNGSVNVDTPPLADPFQVPTKTARELLLFDAQATPFRPVRVQAQVLYTDAQAVYAVNEGLGVRLMSTNSSELHPGDLVEAVGYPEIGGPSPLLRQALIRKTGSAQLPQPRLLTGPSFPMKGLDSTLVRVEAKLLAMHTERSSPVLEVQSSGHLYVARVKLPGEQLSLRLGSKLQLAGVFAATGRRQLQGSVVESFALLLNSPADIVVLSQPSWWTLERLGAVVGFLLVVLMLAAAWITQLRRQVDQRTAQLQLEIRERERAEHHRALEAERARIARDLHDDLGSSLTEIGALASTGQQGTAVAGGPPELFDAIAGKARGSIAALDVIVWAVDPEDNSLQSMADYLSGFAGEYLSHSNVVCRFKIPVSLPELMFEGRIRHDLFLAVKETLNNVVRHAQATEVEFSFVVTPNALEIVIADNGRGFDASAATEGNGLHNLRSRLEKLGGSCVVESKVAKGTIVRIRLPLAKPNGSLATTDGLSAA
jgi:signal transduction histidine kinase